jgi:hypothetical protein
MKYFLFLILPLFVFSCKTEKVLSDLELAKKQEKSNSNIMLTAALGEKIERNDAYTITNIMVVGNKLIVDVIFSGGCMLHEFKAIGLPMNNQAIQPIRQIQLSHNSNRDNCDKLISLTLEIDLKPIALNQQVGGKTIFILDGWKDQITYIVE